jgi:hypothetical protein
MKKIISIIFAILLLKGVSFATFTDVPETHWAYEAITKSSFPEKDGKSQYLHLLLQKGICTYIANFLIEKSSIHYHI